MAADPRRVAIGMAAGRIAIGAGLWLAPEWTARTLGLDELDSRAMMLARLAATRDLVLGAWQLSAIDDPPTLRRVSAAAVLVDVGDTLTFALAAREDDERGAGLRGFAVALPAAAIGAWLAARA